MNESKIIPKFKRKEIDSRYLDDDFDDESTIRMKSIYQSMIDYGFELNLSDVIALNEYYHQISDYADELMSLITGEEKMDYILQKHENFRMEFHPETKMESLLFRIYIAVLNEWLWADSIFELMEECQDDELNS